MKELKKSIGQTKDSGWQFGLRKTFDLPQKDLWDFMFSDEGLNVWLSPVEGELETDKAFQTREGLEVKMKLLKPYSHVRMTWKKKGWDHDSNLQVRVLASGKKATISFHHDKLINQDERVEMSIYWNKKMLEIGEALSQKIVFQ